MTSTVASIAALSAAVLWLARFGLFLALHLVPSDYSWRENAVSDYAVGATRRLATISTWVAAGAWGAEALAVWRGLPHWSGRTAATLWLLVLTALFVALPWLPTDLEGTRATLVGRVHLVAAVAWFAIAYSLTGPLSRSLAGAWSEPALRWLHLASALSLIALVTALLIPRLRPIAFGVTERVFLLAVTSFHLLVAVTLALR